MSKKDRRFHVIALTGATGSGKSTVAEHLVTSYGFTRVSIAKPRWGFSPRWIMQRLATEGIRDVLGADTWLDFACREILTQDGGRFVVDDLRFLNEAKRFFGLSTYALQRFAPHANLDYVHSCIIRLEGVRQGVDEFQGHPSETEQLQPEFAALVRDIVTAPKSPGARVLLDRFDEALLSYGRSLAPDARADLFRTQRGS